MWKRLKSILDPGKARADELARVRAERCRPWFAIDGDRTLRLDYDLDETSVVFDLGGYEGGWSAQIDERYRPRLFIFEPVGRFESQIRQRFSGRDHVQVFAFGLGKRTEDLRIHVSADSSSIFEGGEAGATERIRLVKADDFLQEQGLERIDLMKINIEGGEYDLLEHLLDVGWAERVRDIQVQFHDFVPDAEERMRAIQRRLERTHHTTYQYEFVWENWRLGDASAAPRSANPE